MKVGLKNLVRLEDKVGLAQKVGEEMDKLVKVEKN